MITTILINIVCSIIASTIFLFIVLYTLRPKIDISHYISKQLNTFDNIPASVYMFKIINKSFFSAFDIHLELFKMEQYRVTATGNNYRIKVVPLIISNIKHLPPFKSTGSCKKTSLAPHCTLFRTTEPLEELLVKENDTLQLQITLRHGLTSLSRVYRKDYISTKDIKTAPFTFGNSLEID